MSLQSLLSLLIEVEVYKTMFMHTEVMDTQSSHWIVSISTRRHIKVPLPEFLTFHKVILKPSFLTGEELAFKKEKRRF